MSASLSVTAKQKYDGAIALVVVIVNYTFSFFCILAVIMEAAVVEQVVEVLVTTMAVSGSSLQSLLLYKGVMKYSIPVFDVTISLLVPEPVQ